MLVVVCVHTCIYSPGLGRGVVGSALLRLQWVRARRLQPASPGVRSATLRVRAASPPGVKNLQHEKAGECARAASSPAARNLKGPFPSAVALCIAGGPTRRA
eukprot:scaffold931_cov383-Prasinococcus_capsulatus_cf.AAC.24